MGAATEMPSSMLEAVAVPDSGLAALAHAARHYGVSVEPEQLAHRLGRVSGVADSRDICRCARLIGVRARAVDTGIDRIAALPLPALIHTARGWLVLEATDTDSAVLHDPTTSMRVDESHVSLVELWQGHAILLGEEAATRSGRQAFGFAWFLPSIYKHMRQFRSILLVSLMLQLIALVTPALFENIIDRVLVSRSVSSLQVLGIALLVLAVLEPVYGFLRSWLFSNLAAKINSELSARVYQHLITLPIGYFRKRQTGEIIARVGEMDHIRQFLTGSTLTMVIDLLFLGLFVAAMLFYSVKLTWVVLGTLAIYFCIWMVFGPLLRVRVKRGYELGADNTAFLTESVTGIEVIKTTATESTFSRRWEGELAGFVRAEFRSKIMGIAIGQGVGLVQKLSGALLLWWGIRSVMEGKLSPGELVAFNMLAGHLTQPILRLAQTWQDLQHALISLRRVGDVLDEPAENGNGGLASIPALQGRIAFRGVHFRYGDDGQEVLRGLDLEVRPGEFIGITGPSGSGKSTIGRLLQRLYVPQRGQVLVDGVDLAIADPMALRRRMSVVPQESVLFSGTVAENIALCRPQACEAEVVEAATLAGADSFIRSLPEGYGTQVGERGARLSGGQRQRIALARALLTRPKILLLDEATSALDYESEAAIMANLEAIAEGRTVISIAHRLNTLCYADRILVVDRGAIIESGSHRELVARDTTYARLWRLQMG
ncbi:type I secretion system permease/ATPase [Lysobacter antibioticus]|uniref:Alpha-hemolysin translocation ATP-binding protein hlyB n=1 Tax=Lysobacter antibioticus TaxID=84531 RepID=A0A0S2F525_LYSAN|nr:type I secretion system permease/ATPase [Lysobacter antibioticus]ALN78624.1 alpha-hemolysin translocation ATP-binding protein hlyB [Lysobacter antibioticus]